MTVAQTSPAKNASARGSGRLRPLRLSKVLIFVAAGLSLVMSVALWFAGDRERGLFVGIWVPSILSAGSLLLSGGQQHE